ncbi:MAG: S9 family peptidase [Bacteroidaceae bacterium]|nr:S9 family peptidase [Bacteroidaceae bacterium]
MKIKLCLAVILMAMCTTVSAQKNLTLNDVLGSGNNAHNLRPENRYTQWWGNTLVETTPDEVKNLLTGETIVSVQQVLAALHLQEKGSINGHYLSFPYANQTIVRASLGRRCIEVNFKTGTVTLDCMLPEGAANSDFNLVSKYTAYTIQGNLYVMDAKGNSQQVSRDGSTDGSDNIVYGTSVHRDEFGITKGTFWSPDGQQLAFYRMDQSMVPSYPQVNIFSRISETYTDHYPMAGETSHQVKVGIYNVQTQKTVWLDLEGASDDYHTNISWAPDGKTIYVFELNRDQNDMRLVAYDAETGKSLHTVLQECDDKYVEPMNGLDFLPWDATKAIMQSQRDGYNHLYLLDLKTDKLTQITCGKWVVQKFVGFNTKDKTIIYQGNESDPRRSCIYSISVKGGKLTLIGENDGVHSAELSADGQQVLDRYTSPTVPRSINLLSTKTGKGKNLFTATDRWAELGYNIPEITSGSIKAADGVTDLYYRMVKPIDFDPSKKYPTVIYVYGGPHAHNVEASWHWGLRGWEAYMATKGYLLFILDNRGSEWRGKDFEQATFRQLGEIEMQDQMEGVKYLRSLPYVDADRMGVHGWSYGGFMTTNLMCSYPDVFKVGVAGGPVIDWKYYEVMYGERYMDTPQTNPMGYEKCSLVNKAKNLKGRLQIIYGYNDPTCVPQHTLSFINACVNASTQPDLFTYPGEGHNMRGIKQIHLHERITRYFEDYLK